MRVTKPVSFNGEGEVKKMKEKRITSFRDLEVYNNSYSAMMVVIEEILPRLPAHERYDLTDQLNRACKAIPRLIAEGYAKRHQRMGFQKYIDDAMAECNEMVVSICQARDIYSKFVKLQICDELIDLYDKTGRQLFKLGCALTNFKRRQTSPFDDTGIVPITDSNQKDE